MNDYAKLLEQVAEQADPRVLPAPASIRQASNRRRNRNTIVVGAVAAFTALAVSVAIAAGGGNPAPTPAKPVGPAQTDSAFDPASPYGEPVTVQPGLDYFDPRAVAYFDARGGGADAYVVVGDTSGTFTGPRPTPPIWWSADARNWHHASTGLPNVWDVTAFGGGLVAVAPRGLRASTAWLSVDGDRWVQASVPDGFHVFTLSSTPDRVFAWDDHRVFTSTGGDEWVMAATPPGLAKGKICFVAGKDEVVLGALVRREPAAWVLKNGQWQSTSPPKSSDSDWCRQHEKVNWSAEGPAGTVTVRPYGDNFNTVFVREN